MARPVTKEADRKPRDIVCYILFIIFLILWIFTFAYALSKGDPKKLIVPFDEDRRGCGYDSDLKDYKYLYFYQLGKNSTEWQAITSSPNYNRSSVLTAAFCVNQCPPSSYLDNSKTLADLGIKCATKDKEGKTAEGLMCDTYKGYNSTTWLVSFCIPAFDTLDPAAKEISTSILTTLDQSSTVQKLLKDIMICWWVFLISFGVTMFISSLYMFSFLVLPRYVIWVIIIVLIIIVSVGGFMCMDWEEERQYKIDRATGSGIYVIILRIEY